MQANCEGDFSVVEVPMMAIACLLGDYDSIFCLRKICHKSSVEPKSFCDIHAESNLFDKYPAIMINKILSGVQPGSEIDFFDRNVEWEGSVYDQYEIERELRENGCGLSLKVGIKASNENVDVKSAIIRSCVHDSYGIVSKYDAKTVYLPGLDEQDIDGVEERASFFHRNEEGKVTFTPKEAKHASNFIASFGLEERVKSALQKKRFVLPQKTDEVNSHFCNEFTAKSTFYWCVESFVWTYRNHFAQQSGSGYRMGCGFDRGIG